MVIYGREIVYHRQFGNELKKITRYIKKYSNKASFDFIGEVKKMIIDRIAQYPTHFPEYQDRKTPQRMYRKAIFKKKYNIIYKIEPKRLYIVYIFHSSRDMKNVQIDFV